MSSDFSGLLQRAEQLASEIDRFPAAVSSDGFAADLPRVERNLRQLMDAGQQLFAKTSKDIHLGSQDVKASVLLGSKGVDLPSITNALDSIVSTSGSGFEQVEAVRDTDVAGFLKSERENAILAVIEETRKDTFEAAERLHWKSTLNEWDRTKRQILDDLSGVPESASAMASETLTEVTRVHDGLRASSLSHLEMAYAKQVVLYNEQSGKGGLPPNAIEIFSAPFNENTDAEATLVWSMVQAMSGLESLPEDVDQAVSGRISASKAIVQMSKKYLEKTYLKYVQQTVFANLQQAQLGGIPGTYHLVKSFLNVKLVPNAPGLEDGQIDTGAPVWPMVYFCLRCGDIDAAIQATNEAGPGLAEMSKLLAEIKVSGDGRLAPHTENVVRISYKRSVRNTTDPYKRAVYCILGACDPLDEHSEVATSLDDYLWIKLLQIRETAEDALTLSQLQKTMLEDYGESHFNAFEQPVLYFQVLLLTGQFEAAVDFLFRVDRFKAHGVHIGLALFEKKMLLLPQNIQSPLLTSAQTSTKRLNVARLVILYTRKFEGSDPKEALNYFYLLRGMESPSGQANGNLFTTCVSELVLESREYDLLLGRILPDGARLPGLIDKYSNDVNGLVNIQNVIQAVAEDSERKGMFEDSVKLYDLASMSDKVIELLNKLLAQVVTQPNVSESRRDRLQRQAFEIARRYSALGHSASKDPTAAFFLLLDLMTFFDAYHGKKYDDALGIIAKLRIIPLVQSEVDAMVSTFRLLADEVRRNVPDVLLATMNILFNNYKESRGGPSMAPTADGGREKHLERLRDQAKSIITFAGIIPYRMPGDTNARLVQMEVLMN